MTLKEAVSSVVRTRIKNNLKAITDKDLQKWADSGLVPFALWLSEQVMNSMPDIPPEDDQDTQIEGLASHACYLTAKDLVGIAALISPDSFEQLPMDEDDPGLELPS